MDILLTSRPKAAKTKPDVYTSFWIFFMGSVAGFAVETVWCLFKHGRFEIRSSMVFGPFTVIYGFGALLLYLGLSHVDKNNYLHMIIFGAIGGAIVEYVCSLFQETFIGSVSWDYSAKPFNLGGRVCLLYSVYWGLLSVGWCKFVGPFLEDLISKIPSKLKKQLAVGLLVFIVVDIIISIVAVHRWGMRINGKPAGNFIVSLFDAVFPNTIMKAIYPNMIW